MSFDLVPRRAVETLYRPLVVVAVVFLAMLIGRHPSTLFLLLIVAALGGLILLRRPELGVVAVLVSALLVPFSIGTGTQTRLHAALLLIPVLLVLWLLDMVMRQDVRLAPSPTNLPLLALALSATISFLAGNMPWNYFAEKASLAAQTGGWMIFILSAAVFLLVGNQIKDLRWLQRLTSLFLALGAVYIVGRIAPFAWPGAALFQAGATGSLFWVWLVALAGGQAMFNQDLPRPQRMMLAGLVVITLGIGFFQGRSWASGWMPGLAAFGVLVWLRSWRAGLLLTLVVLLAVIVDRSLSAGVVVENQYSIDTRQVAAEIILGQVLQANPIIGLGPANYYHYTPLFPILGWYVKFNSHNQYVDIIAQTGLVGMAAFAWLMAVIGRLGWNLRQRVQHGFARGYVYACLAGLAGSLVAGMLGDWFLPFVYNIGLAGMRASLLAWLFLGGLVVIRSSVSGQPSAEASQ